MFFLGIIPGSVIVVSTKKYKVERKSIRLHIGNMGVSIHVYAQVRIKKANGNTIRVIQIHRWA
jgi:hypothetical protein